MTQTTIPFEYSSNYRPPEQNKKKQSDSLYLNKNVNGWDVTVSINLEGKVSLIAHKHLGSIAKAATAGDNESYISIDVESTEKRVPEFKQIVLHSKYVLAVEMATLVTLSTVINVVIKFRKNCVKSHYDFQVIIRSSKIL